MTNFEKQKIKEFEKEFCNNHQQPIRFLRSIFYDEQDGAEQIENFLIEALHQARLNALEEASREIERYFYESAILIPYPDPITQEKHIQSIIKTLTA